MTSHKISLKNLTITQIKEKFKELKEPSFRWKQVVKWVYQKRIKSFDEMSNISKKSKQVFNDNLCLSELEQSHLLVSRKKDAVKFGFKLSDNAEIVESVLLLDNKRRTACISSQLGCGLGCTFCETGKMGFIRNLSQEEILGQVLAINEYLESKGDRPVSNIVFMGMGEALSNFKNFRSALEIIMDENGLGLGGRKITVSTAGVVPSIERLIKENLNLGLAISLNTFNNVKRDIIMPINKKYPIESLMKIARKYFDVTGRRVTFEYVVIDGENDTPEAIEALSKMLNNVTCKINLIPVNPCSSCSVNPPSDRKINLLNEQLLSRGLFVTIRKSRGQDICGACGQLSSGVRC